MHQLSRRVRFCINPFLSESNSGYNGFCARPTGEGLAIYLELGIKLEHSVDPDTGFVINVVDIDAYVRQFGVPLFDQYISRLYKQSEHISLAHLTQLLKDVFDLLFERFKPCSIVELSLYLSPSRTLTMKSHAPHTLFYTEKFEFAAMHKLWNDRFNTQQNLEAFGKCANASGHGHNYWIDVTVSTKSSGKFNNIAFQKTVNDRFIEIMDHTNLNEDVAHFKTHIPTIENISEYAWQCLNGHFEHCSLDSVTVWESDRTCCTYSNKS